MERTRVIFDLTLKPLHSVPERATYAFTDTKYFAAGVVIFFLTFVIFFSLHLILLFQFSHFGKHLAFNELNCVEVIISNFQNLN